VSARADFGKRKNFGDLGTDNDRHHHPRTTSPRSLMKNGEGHGENRVHQGDPSRFSRGSDDICPSNGASMADICFQIPEPSHPSLHRSRPILVQVLHSPLGSPSKRHRLILSPHSRFKRSRTSGSRSARMEYFLACSARLFVQLNYCRNSSVTLRIK